MVSVLVETRKAIMGLQDVVYDSNPCEMAFFGRQRKVPFIFTTFHENVN